MEPWEESFDTWTPEAPQAPQDDPRAELEGLKLTLREAAGRVAELQHRLEARLAALDAREAAVEARERALDSAPSLSDDLAARARAQTHSQS